jgi:hypothetical protein
MQGLSQWRRPRGEKEGTFGSPHDEGWAKARRRTQQGRRALGAPGPKNLRHDQAEELSSLLRRRFRGGTKDSSI